VKYDAVLCKKVISKKHIQSVFFEKGTRGNGNWYLDLNGNGNKSFKMGIGMVMVVSDGRGG